MERVGANFSPDQVAIRKQLTRVKRIVEVVDHKLVLFFERTDPDFYSIYRWILVQFKREFPFEGISSVWELFWLDHVCPRELHLYVCAALLIYQRDRVLKLQEGEFDQILRFVNSMLTRTDPVSAVKLGARLYMRVGAVTGHMSRPQSALSDDLLHQLLW